ncbi:MAG: hemerythrin domain-containing protein [Deltaproteobacteria bacterium]|nr:hemerythrin domain-containing protein [Candidatus Zymogenaceae bacterium]
MKSLKYLEKEMKFIESLLEMLDHFTRRLDNGKDVPPYMFKEIIELLQIYIDVSHIMREEVILRFLGTCGIDAPTEECDQTHASIKKHERFLLMVIEAYDLGYQGARGIFAYYAKRYIWILRQHLKLENELLIKWIDNQEHRDGEILRQFKKIEVRVKRTRERGIVRMEALKRESQMIRA